jgi:bifunctional DNase/RNase
MALEGTQPHRPMTHDLTIQLLATLGAQVRQVVVNKIVDNTFYAEITTTLGDRQHIVDARPSDALALAVRAGVPIYVARTVVEQCSGPDDDAFWMAMAERVRQFHEQAEQADAAQQPSAE